MTFPRHLGVGKDPDSGTITPILLLLHYSSDPPLDAHKGLGYGIPHQAKAVH
jgi:hypothetical protein